MTQQSELRLQLARACRRLLSALDRDPYSPTFGCFDRRYWAWKMVDAPELTYQRNVWTLAWHLARGGSLGIAPETLADGAASGLRFAAARQHRDGSFDQAFPGEHSYGATAFLLHDAALTVALLREAGAAVPADADAMMARAARFLSASREQHGFIANHLAGAAAALRAWAAVSGDARHTGHADALLQQVMASQHAEGWFPEYGGADPGYQSLCLYYLAHAAQLGQDEALEDALHRGIRFLGWFAHPDGSFAGEYGSRRTAVLYPGGLAMMAARQLDAAPLARFALDGLVRGTLAGLDQLDDGNLAPMAANCIAAADVEIPATGGLPFEQDGAAADFPAAGLFVRSAGRLHVVIGASNGGVIKAFDRRRRAPVFEDTGYAASVGGTTITSQSRDGTTWQVTADAIVVDGSFARLSVLTPGPWRFVAWRLVGLTAMRLEMIREWAKRQLVVGLMTPRAADGPRLRREIRVLADRVDVNDVVADTGRVEWIESGRSFVAVHMASARYFPGFGSAFSPAVRHAIGGRSEWRRSFTIA